jgi:hypothetical protein
VDYYGNIAKSIVTYLITISLQKPCRKAKRQARKLISYLPFLRTLSKKRFTKNKRFLSFLPQNRSPFTINRLPSLLLPSQHLKKLVKFWRYDNLCSAVHSTSCFGSVVVFRYVFRTSSCGHTLGSNAKFTLQ